MLATYLPIPVLTLLGDVPPAPAGSPPWLQNALYFGPLVGWYLFSTVVAELNQMVRERDEMAEISPNMPPNMPPITPRFRFWLSVANRIAANHDKAKQQASLAKAPEVKP